MAEQVKRTSGRVRLSDGLGEAGEIGDITPPIIDPDERRITDVTRRLAVPAMIEHAYRIASEQEIPDEFVVLLRELGEPMTDHDRTAEGRSGAAFAFRIEPSRVIAQVVQLAAAAASTPAAGQRFEACGALGGRRIEPAFVAAGFQSRNHRVPHRFGVPAFIDHVQLRHAVHPTRGWHAPTRARP